MRDEGARGRSKDSPRPPEEVPPRTPRAQLRMSPECRLVHGRCSTRSSRTCSMIAHSTQPATARRIAQVVGLTWRSSRSACRKQVAVSRPTGDALRFQPSRRAIQPARVSLSRETRWPQQRGPVGEMAAHSIGAHRRGRRCTWRSTIITSAAQCSMRMTTQQVLRLGAHMSLHLSKWKIPQIVLDCRWPLVGDGRESRRPQDNVFNETDSQLNRSLEIVRAGSILTSTRTYTFKLTCSSISAVSRLSGLGLR